MSHNFYSLSRILQKNAQYNMIIGERSNGKTFACLKYGLKRYCVLGEQMAIVRRWSEDFTGKRGQTMFDAIEQNGLVSKYTRGEWTGIYYFSSRWFLCKYDDKGKRITDNRPFAYAFAISAGEHDKSTSYPGIRTIVFDEFLTRNNYLKDEFVLFMQVVSTICRQRKDIKIFMLGNTVNKFSPYFREMGLSNVQSQTQGTIDVYKYGTTDLRVAVEYCAPAREVKPSNTLFAFDNPKLQMITGGSWEIDLYPHCPVKFYPNNIEFVFFVIWESHVLQCEVVAHEEGVFIFVHPKTTPIKKTNEDLIFSPEFTHRPNWVRKLTKPMNNVTQKIAELFKNDRVFYSDNWTGEIMRAYLKWCRMA